jgi:glycosyltransferase involved in cell wall biosynthesis
MKLAFVINVFREDDFHSGGERVFYEFVNRAVNLGCVVDLYCTTYLGNKNNLKPKINKINFIGHPKDFKYPEKIEKFYDEVKKLIQNENYDHIISENIAPPIDIGILQGHSLLHYRELSGNFLSKLIFTLQKHKYINAQKKWLKQGYKKIIVPSNTLKEELKRNFAINDEIFAVIYPGVDNLQTCHSEGFSPKNLSNDESGQMDRFFAPLRMTEEIQGDSNKSELIFGLSAPSFSKKGGNIFLKSLSILKKKGYKFKAKIIYPKAKKNLKLRFLLFKHGLREFIEFLPYQENMQNFYKSVDAVVMPSLMETFGLVALEGMINGKPAVVSSNCGASEIFQDDFNGFVFDMKKNSSENLAEKLIYLLENRNKYPELSKNAYKTALKYNWQDFCDNFFDEINKRASRERSNRSEPKN